MVVVYRPGAKEASVERGCARLRALGFGVHLFRGARRMVVEAIGDASTLDPATLEVLDDVERVSLLRLPFRLVSREFQPEPSVVRVGGVPVGGAEVAVIAGPCSVESFDQALTTARAVRAAGARLLRGGAFKPRTSPYDFRGIGEEALRILAAVREETGLPVVTEVMRPDAVELVARYADCLQIGARNAQNYDLLREVGRADKAVLLKRGPATTVQEWLMAAEYVLAGGNRDVILCERGIRSFESQFTRYTLDLNAVPVVKEFSHLPVVVDPSHGTGKAAYVPALARAGIAAGADGLIIEVHPRPEEALSDAAQTLDCDAFARLMGQVRRVAAAVGRGLEQAGAAAGA